MTNKLAIVFGLSVLGAALPLPGAKEVARDEAKQSFSVTKTEHVNFGPGGVIRLENSYGYLSVDGWDDPEVEITVTKSTNSLYEPQQKEQALQRLGLIGVTIERRSDAELAITTTLASRHGDWSPPLPHAHQAGVTVEYQLHVPRDSRLVVHQRNGYVWVSDVTGDIEVNSGTGDMVLKLPDLGPYAIDAQTHMGSVTSDFVGKASNRFVTGTHFAYADPAPTRKVYLRMGRGSITIKKGPPVAPFGKD